MSAPLRFTVRRVATSDSITWAYDGAESEAAWLPRLGPTSWALMRVLDRDAAAGDSTTFTVATLAAQLGTSPTRLWTSVTRLVQFNVLARDVVGDVSVFTLPLRLAVIDAKQWRRLSDVVRDAHADLAPTERQAG